MKRICVVCEGATEANFVTQCLEPHLRLHNIYAYPSILKAASGKHKGGRVTIERLVKHLSRESHSFDRLTTLVDFYGFQDREDRSRDQLEKEILEGVQKYAPKFDSRFLLPYVQMHEFEALLFSDIEQFKWVIDGWNDHARQLLIEINTSVTAGPEAINTGKKTAPSKRIAHVFGEAVYSKTEHGPIIAVEIGLEKIRSKCPNFNDWLGKLETWGI
jgi:Domain of unknown function (DUF4276)